MLGLERQLDLVALLAPVPAMTPRVAKGFPARAQIVEKLFHVLSFRMTTAAAGAFPSLTVG
jgi:hypothetical protein